MTHIGESGVISRGIDFSEEQIVEAETLAPAHRSMIEKAEQENQVLARVLRAVPLELMPQFVSFFKKYAR